MSVAATAAQVLPEPGVAAENPGGSPSPNLESSQKAELEESRWVSVLSLPCRLTVDLPLPGFKVADLLKLQSGSVIGTNWHVGRDVPLRINGTLIGWSEFEVVGNRLAVRLTELA
jgi:flagellar motor switch/type III secretory pathway protein FliN